MKLAIFDLDGTLIDSRRMIHDAMAQAYDRCGLEHPGVDRVRRVVGLGLRQAFRTLEPDLPEHMLDTLEAAYVEAFVILRETEAGRESLYEGVRDLLDRLRRDGWKLGVATGKSRRGVSIVLRAHDLENVFHATVCADDGPGKPDPFMVRENLRLTGVNPAKTLVVGDATHDMAMARAAGVRAVGVCWGFAQEDELRSAGAHELHHDRATLRDALTAFGSEW